MSKSHQLNAGGAATNGEQRQDHPAGGTLVHVTPMAPPGGREPGSSKERRLEHHRLAHRPAQVPLMVPAFEGNKTETKTMLPVIESFRVCAPSYT